LRLTRRLLWWLPFHWSHFENQMEAVPTLRHGSQW
jgi:hypothetical protein